jgi:hypothetical protein
MKNMITLAREIAFIDPAVDDIETLLGGLRPEVYPIRLDAVTPAPAQMARALAGLSGLTAIHVISHGTPGAVCFAAGELSPGTLANHHGDLAAIGRAIGGGGEFCVWACRVLTYDDDDSAVLNFVVPSGGIFPSPIHRRVEIASRDQPSQDREVVDEFQGRVSLADAQGHYHHITDEESIELLGGESSRGEMSPLETCVP